MKLHSWLISSRTASSGDVREFDREDPGGKKQILLYLQCLNNRLGAGIHKTVRYSVCRIVAVA